MLVTGSFTGVTGLSCLLSGVTLVHRKTHLSFKSNDIHVGNVSSTFSSGQHLGAIFSSERIKAEDRKARREMCICVRA